jgi:hypothetical protein
MPVADGFQGGLVRVDGHQLRKRNGHFPALPTDQHEHVVRAVIFRCHANHFSSFAFSERRDNLCGDAFRRERKTDFVFEVVIPAIACSSGLASTMASFSMRASRIASLRGFFIGLRWPNAAHRGPAVSTFQFYLWRVLFTASGGGIFHGDSEPSERGVDCSEFHPPTPLILQHRCQAPLERPNL